MLVRLFIHSSVRSFIRSFARSFVVRSSFSGDEGTVDMATPRPTNPTTRIPAPASPPKRHAVAAATSHPDAIAGEGTVPEPRAEQRGKRPHALHTCAHRPGTPRRMRETEWQWRKRGAEEDGAVGWSVGRLHSSVPRTRPGAEIGDALALARGFLPFLRKK